MGIGKLLAEFQSYEANEFASEEDQETLMRVILDDLKKRKISAQQIMDYGIEIKAPEYVSEIKNLEDVAWAVSLRLRALGGIWQNVTVCVKYKDCSCDKIRATFICLK